MNSDAASPPDAPDPVRARMTSRSRRTRVVGAVVAATLLVSTVVVDGAGAGAGVVRNTRSPVSAKGAAPRASVTPRAITTFTNVALKSGWSGAVSASIVNGVVRLQGSATPSGWGTVAFTLPVQFRPAFTIRLPIAVNCASLGMLTIAPNGSTDIAVISPTGVCPAYVDSVTFLVSEATPLALQNGWTAWGPGAANPSVRNVDGTVYLKGAMKTANASANAFTLPAALRPSRDVYLRVRLCNGDAGRLWIRANGLTTVESATTFASAKCFTSLDGASFPLGAGSGYSEFGPWTAYGAPVGAPGVTITGNIAHLQGGLKGSSSTPIIGELSPGTFPAREETLEFPVTMCNATPGIVQLHGPLLAFLAADPAAAACFLSLEGISFPIAPRAQFSPITLLNGWTNLGSPFGPAEYAKTDSTVYLRGAIKTAQTNDVAFQLPAAMRPNHDVYTPVDLCNGYGYLQISGSTGDVRVRTQGAFSTAQCRTSLDGVSFNLGSGTAFGLTNGWTPAGAVPTYSVAHGVVRLQGGVTNTSPVMNAVIAVLPILVAPTREVNVLTLLCGGAPGRLTIATNGVVSVSAQSFAEARCFTSLEVTYMPEFESTKITPMNGWGVDSGGAATASLIEGTVHLTGVLVGGIGAAPAFVLPPALRPSSYTVVATLRNRLSVGLTAAEGVVTIDPDGAVYLVSNSSSEFVSLWGVEFGLDGDPDRVITTSWSNADITRLTQMGQSLGNVPASQVPKVATAIVSFLVGLGSLTPTPITPPVQGSAVTLTDTWTPGELPVVTTLTKKYALSYSSAEYFATKLIDYLLALGGH